MINRLIYAYHSKVLHTLLVKTPALKPPLTLTAAHIHTASNTCVQLSDLQTENRLKLSSAY